MLISSLQDTTETLVVGALGATECEGRPGVLKLLVEGDKVYEIEEALWLPLEKHLLKLPFHIKISLSGKTVMAAEAFTSEEEGAQAKPM